MTSARQGEAAASRPTKQQPSRRHGYGTGFVGATASFVAVFAAGATPIPLYDRYRIADGVTNTDLSVVAVAYFVCAVAALLLLGRLSNYVGRRPVALAALLIAALGCVVLMTVHGVGPLLLGRSLQGLAAGLAASTLAAYAVDTALSTPRWLIGAVTSAATNVGLAIGAFTAGALVDYGPVPRVLPLGIATAVLLVCAVLIVVGPETVTLTPGALRSVLPRIVVPAGARPALPAAAAVFVATWALGGYYQAFGPSVAADDLHSSSSLLAATVFASYLAPTVLGAPLTAQLTPTAAQRVGMTAVTLAAGGLVVAIITGTPTVFILAGLLGGIGQGAAMAGSLRALLPHASSTERAGLLALVYAISYTGAAVPSLIAGQLSRTVDLTGITAGYGILAALALVITLIRHPTASPQR